MRVFIYTTKIVSHSRKYGYNKVEAVIYEVINNIPRIVLRLGENGEPCGRLIAKWNTSSFMGEQSTIYQTLSQNGIIDKVSPNDYYFNDNPNIRIIEV